MILYKDRSFKMKIQLILDPAQINVKLHRVVGGAAMKHTLLTDLEFALEAFFHHVFDALAKLRDGNFRHDLVGKGKHEQHARTVFANPPLSQVKHRFGIQLAGC